MQALTPVEWYVIGLASATLVAWLADVMEEPTDVIIVMILGLLGPIITAFALIAGVLRFLVWIEDRVRSKES